MQRPTLSPEDVQARDLLVSWLQEIGLEVTVEDVEQGANVLPHAVLQAANEG